MCEINHLHNKKGARTQRVHPRLTTKIDTNSNS